MSLFGRRNLHQATQKYKQDVAYRGGSISSSAVWITDRLVTRPLICAGLSNQMLRVNLGIGNTTFSSTIPLIYTGTIDTAVNFTNADYSQSTGWKTDGSSKYINTNTLMTSSLGGIGGYLRTDQTGASGVQAIIGSANSSASIRHFCRQINTNTAQAYFGASSTSAISGAMTPGLYASARTSLSRLDLYKNGISISNSTSTVTSTSGTDNLTVMAINQGGSIIQFLAANSLVSGYHIDTGLSASDSLKFYNIIQTFNTALNRQV